MEDLTTDTTTTVNKMNTTTNTTQQPPEITLKTPQKSPLPTSTSPEIPTIHLSGETSERVYELLQVVWRYQRAVAAADQYVKRGRQHTAVDWCKVSRYLARVRLERQVAMMGGAVSYNTGEAVWSPAHCRKVWKAAAYGINSGSESSSASSSSSSTHDDASSDNESMESTVAPPDVFHADGWEECVEERERAILEESFVLSGGALYRRKCHAIQHLKRSRRDIEHQRPRSPLFITAHIPSRERQGLGLRIEEIDMGSRQAVVMGEPHPWSENNIHIMSEFERGERAKICPGQELLAINGGQLVPATLERAVELVASAASPVQLTLRFPPENGRFNGGENDPKRRRKN